MTDSKDAEYLADDQKEKRRRTRDYGERRAVTLRIEPELHERMMDLCDDLKIPANTYLLKLIESDLKKKGM